MGLPKANRLKNYQTVRQVYREGKVYQSSHLVLRVLSHLSTSSEDRSPQTRFGITISRKVSKKAVIRNRLKRQIRSAIRPLLPQMTSGWQIMIIVRPHAVECNYEHFLRELKQLLIQAGIIYGH